MWSPFKKYGGPKKRRRCKDIVTAISVGSGSQPHIREHRHREQWIRRGMRKQKMRGGMAYAMWTQDTKRRKKRGRDKQARTVE